MFSRRLLGWAAAAVLAGSPEAGARKLPVRIFTVADGLPQNEIACIIEDSRGFLWIGTTDGLVRFDGREFVTYGVADGLPNPVVNDAFEAPDGSLWLATGEGVSRFSVTEPLRTPRAFSTYRLAPGNGTNFVFRLHADRKGRIWAGAANGLFVLEPRSRSFRPVPLDLPRPPSAVMVNAASMCEAAGGDLWVGTAWALVRILADGRQIRYLPTEPNVERGVRDLHWDARGNLWISRSREIVIYRPLPVRAGEAQVLLPSPGKRCVELAELSPRPGETCRISRADGLPDSYASVYESRSGNVRLLADRGLFQPVANGFERDETAHTVAPAALTCLLEDHHGNLWLGTQTGGLVRIARTGFSTYGPEDGLVQEKVNSVFEDASGGLHVTTTGGAIHRLDGDRFSGVMPALPASITYFGWGWSQIALQDRAGRWWYATGQGLARYPAVRGVEDLARTPPERIYTAHDGLPGNNIFRIFEDSRGDVWIGTIGAGEEAVARWERSSGKIRVEPVRPERAAAASAFGEDGAGNVWIGFYEGRLARLRGGRWETLMPETASGRGLITQIFRDSRGRLWITTKNHGVIRVDDPSAAQPSYRVYGTAEGLSGDRAFAVTEDRSGRIYVGNSGGIDRLEPSTGRIRHYTAASGVAPPATVSAFTDRLGRLWFATHHGLLRFDPDADRETSPPRALLRSIEVGGIAMALPAGGLLSSTLPELESGQSPVRVKFFAPYLAPAERVQFRYRLEGSGGEWTTPSPDDTVQYVGLSPGRYRLLVEAVTSEGMHSPVPASLRFRVLPPMWRRWWFLAAAGAVAAALLVWLHRERVARLLEVERVRSRIASDLHDDLGTSLYRISILSELAKRHASDPDKDARPLLSEIGETARDLIESAGDMVWSVDPRRDDLGSLAAKIRHYAAEILEAEGIGWSLDGVDGASGISLGPEHRRDLYLIFKEAIHNAVLHGKPSRVALRLGISEGSIEGEIRDDGLGIPPGPSEDNGDGRGIGLRSMRARAEGLGGELRVESETGRGTRILVRVPLAGNA